MTQAETYINPRTKGIIIEKYLRVVLSQLSENM